MSLEVIRNGASVDEEIAELSAGIEALWSLNHPTVWRLLVAERRWTADSTSNGWATSCARSSYEKGQGESHSTGCTSKGPSNMVTNKHDSSSAGACLMVSPAGK